MQFRDMDMIDLKLHLLSGDAINVDGLSIKPYKLSEVKKLGYSNYMETIQMLMISKEDFISSTTDLERRVILEQTKDSLKTLDFYLKLGGAELRKILTKSLSVVFRTNDIKILENNMIVIDFMKEELLSYNDEGIVELNEDKLGSLKQDEVRIINRDNFDEIVQVIKIQNYLDKVESVSKKGYNPADEKARKIAEDLERMRKKIEEKKEAQQKHENPDGEIDIADIVSAVSSKSESINKFNIWDLSIYELYDEYTRLELIDSYNFSVKAMMAGAKDVELRHWSSKINN